MDLLISSLNHMPIIGLWIFQLIFCYTALIILMRFWGAPGIFMFMGVMVISANIQVIKPILFPFYHAPIPLGTALFSATYLASDVLTEYYGVTQAKKGILIAFSAFVLFLICMIMAMGFTPLTHHQAVHSGMSKSFSTQKAMLDLFGPMPGLLIAGMISFLVSQFSDIFLFAGIKKFTHEKYLWFRNIFSTCLAALLDNTVFSLLAWRVFAEHPVPWHTLIFGYILGTYLLRVIMSILDTPFIYFAKKFIVQKNKI